MGVVSGTFIRCATYFFCTLFNSFFSFSVSLFHVLAPNVRIDIMFDCRIFTPPDILFLDRYLLFMILRHSFCSTRALIILSWIYFLFKAFQPQLFHGFIKYHFIKVLFNIKINSCYFLFFSFCYFFFCSNCKMVFSAWLFLPPTDIHSCFVVYFVL